MTKQQIDKDNFDAAYPFGLVVKVEHLDDQNSNWYVGIDENDDAIFKNQLVLNKPFKVKGFNGEVREYIACNSEDTCPDCERINLECGCRAHWCIDLI